MQKHFLKNILDPKRNVADTGIKKIITSPDHSSIRGFKMENLALKTMNVPGRKQIELKGLQNENQHLKDSLEKKEKQITSLQASVEHQKKDSYQKGFEDGKKQGKREAEQSAKEMYDRSIEELTVNTAQALRKLSSAKSALFLDFERDAVDLLRACVQKLFGCIVRYEEQAVLPLLKTAIGAMANTQAITIRVNPEDYKTVERDQEFWLPINKEFEDINIEQDSRIEKRSCSIESDTASVEMKLSDIAEKFDKALQSAYEQKAQRQKAAEAPSPKEGENGK